jgi:3-oxoadipate enol-lactonase
LPVAQAGSYEIHYVEKGSGFPVVLIHGLAGDHTAWAAPMERWSQDHRVLAFDNRGAGQSTQVDEPISTEDMARDTLALMDEVGIDEAHVVGRSMGGAIAQHMALMAPERVHTLVVLASFAKLDPVGVRVLTNMRRPRAPLCRELRLAGVLQREPRDDRPDRGADRRGDETPRLLRPPEPRVPRARHARPAR